MGGVALPTCTTTKLRAGKAWLPEGTSPGSPSYCPDAPSPVLHLNMMIFLNSVCFSYSQYSNYPYTPEALPRRTCKRAELPPQAATAELCPAAGNLRLLQPCQLEHHCSLPPPPAKGCRTQTTDKIETI